MRVLLSAYACEPGAGSEAGVGWRWAIEIAKLGYSTTVVTTSEKRMEIEEAIKTRKYGNIEFVFYEPPRLFLWPVWYRVWPFSVGHRLYWYVWEHIYHFVWQYGAYREMRRIHVKTPFNIVHHITYGAARRSTFMGNIKGAKFILGPLGGGERSPFRIRSLLSRSSKVVEFVRDVSIAASKFNPFLWSSFKKAQLIYMKTAASIIIVPKRYRNKVRVRLEIGRDNPVSRDIVKNKESEGINEFRVLFVGRFLYWKGMEFGIRAFAKLVRHNPGARLIMVGKGPEEENWKRLVGRLSIDKNLEWISWVGKKELERYYRNSDVFLFPSLHDSSGNVVLESITYGLPVVCLDLGGPAEIVDETCARICSTQGKNANDVVDSLYHQMKDLSDNRGILEEMSVSASRRSDEYDWSNIVAGLYNEVVATTP